MAQEIGNIVPEETSNPGIIEKSQAPSTHHDEIEDDPHITAFDDDTGKLTPATWAAVFFLGLTFQAAIGFSFSCVVAILVPIALDLEGNTLNISWIPSGWAVASSVSFAIAGQFSDIFGRRYVMLFGQLCVAIGHIVGGTAQSVGTIIAAETVGGFGTGIIFVAYAGISELVPNKYRSVGLAWTEFNIAPMSIFGSLVAHSLVLHASWRWVFWIGLIFACISLVGTAIFYFPPSRPRHTEKTRAQEFKELDFLGIFLYTVGLTLFLVGISWGGISYPWNSAPVIAPIVIGGILFIACFAWDFSGIPKQPIFPLHLFTKFREYTILLAIVFVAGFTYYSTAGLLPQQMLFMFTTDPIRIGVLNIVQGVGNIFGGVVLSAFIYKMKHVPIQFTVGTFIQTLFLGLYALITPNTLGMALAFQFFANVPFAWLTLLSYVTAGLHVPQRDLGLASGLIGTFRSLGGSIGTAVLNVVLTSKANVEVPKRILEATVPLGFDPANLGALIGGLLSGSPAVLATVPGATSDVIAAAGTALNFGYAYAFRITYLVTIPFGVIVILMSIFVRDPSKYFTKHIAVHLEKEVIGKKHTEQGKVAE